MSPQVICFSFKHIYACQLYLHRFYREALHRSVKETWAVWSAFVSVCRLSIDKVQMQNLKIKINTTLLKIWYTEKLSNAISCCADNTCADGHGCAVYLKLNTAQSLNIRKECLLRSPHLSVVEMPTDKLLFQCNVFKNCYLFLCENNEW